jgi:two-component system, NarL family, invasion response regulator UvrY
MPKLSVALVDDHAMLRNGLASIINDLNEYEVILQSDDGLAFTNKITVDKLVPDIVLLDVSMPHMDGFETAKWISTNLPLAKILVLSMFDDEKSIIKMIRNGAKGYILKDSEPQELEIALNDIVHKGYHYSDLVNGKLIHAVHKLDEHSEDEKQSKLTSREIEFLKLCCSEMTYKEIANIMYLSVRTVEGYRDNLFVKLNLKTRVGLVLYAIKNNIFEM